MPEIITVQLGENANFIGTHYWNMQAQEYDRDRQLNHTLFRSPGGVATPRMVSVGYRGSYHDNSFREATDTSQVTTWHADAIEAIHSETYQTTSYQNLLSEEQSLMDSSQPDRVDRSRMNQLLTSVDLDYNLSREVRVWSDFLRVELSQKSVIELGGTHYEEECSRIQTGSFSQGRAILEDEYEREELVDRVRWLLEECDSFEGFQLFTDCEGLWGGVSDVLISEIRDQFSSHAPIVAYTCSSSQRQRNPLRTLNEGMTIAHLAEQVSLLVPLSSAHLVQKDAFSHIKSKGMNWFQSSAILASAIGSLSRSYTHQHKLAHPLRMRELRTHLGPVAGASIALPFSATNITAEMEKILRGQVKEGDLRYLHQLPSVVPLTGQMEQTYDTVADYYVSRGISTADCQQAHDKLKDTIGNLAALQGFSSSEELFNAFFGLTQPARSVLSSEEMAMAVPSAFPHSQFHGDHDGMVHSSSGRLHSLSTLAHLQTGRNLGLALKSLAEQVADVPFTIKASDRNSVEELLRPDNLHETVNSILTLAEDNDLP